MSEIIPFQISKQVHPVGKPYCVFPTGLNPYSLCCKQRVK
ncbi:hypothetical protein CLOSTMETH_01572 [[Clostridium] methylpentosum DSM 5476]|uniref:Uncharacterized protein n=1 Tax=[Clostridium] methylpentosum DSM 5476 TaxID=537013 RepID=C0ECK1_9FIRM|nr:hypothetical protein CLOSTMETH_01572 [[Clostridium] methylpentosum DSM 5476]